MLQSSTSQQGLAGRLACLAGDVQKEKHNYKAWQDKSRLKSRRPSARPGLLSKGYAVPSFISRLRATGGGSEAELVLKLTFGSETLLLTNPWDLH